MSVYDIRLEVAGGGDEQVWTLISQIKKLVEDRELQFNFLILEKDKKEYPKSRKELEDSEKTKRAQKKSRLENKKQMYEREIADIEKELNEL